MSTQYCGASVVEVVPDGVVEGVPDGVVEGVPDGVVEVHRVVSHLTS